MSHAWTRSASSRLSHAWTRSASRSILQGQLDYGRGNRLSGLLIALGVLFLISSESVAEVLDSFADPTSDSRWPPDYWAERLPTYRRLIAEAAAWHRDAMRG